MYYYLLVLKIGCVPGRLGVGNWFHAKGSLSLLAAASSRSDGATCELRARECEELDLLFFGEYLVGDWAAVAGLLVDGVMLTVGWEVGPKV